MTEATQVHVTAKVFSGKKELHWARLFMYCSLAEEVSQLEINEKASFVFLATTFWTCLEKFEEEEVLYTSCQDQSCLESLEGRRRS